MDSFGLGFSGARFGFPVGGGQAGSPEAANVQGLRPFDLRARWSWPLARAVFWGLDFGKATMCFPVFAINIS